MESMISVIYGIWIFGFLLSSCTIFLQCSFRRKKKEPPPSSLLNPSSPHNVAQKNSTSVPTTTPLSSGGIFQNLKNPSEFAENTQSTQSIRGSPENLIGKKPPSKNAATNKSKTSKIKKNRSKMKKIEKREPSIIKTAHLPTTTTTKKGESKMKSIQLVEERTQEDSFISPSLRAVQEWEKKMRQEFPEISDRTQPIESSVKRIEITETLFSDQLHSPSNFSSHDNLLHEDDQGHEDFGMSLSTHSTINAKTNNDKTTTTTKSSRYIPAHQEVSTPPTTSAAAATMGRRKKADDDDCHTARLPEWKITRT